MYNKVSPLQTAPRYGLIIAAISIAINMLLYVTGLLTNQTVSSFLGIISLVLFILFIHLAIKSHRDDLQGGFISTGQAFLVGLFTALISSLITMVFTYILYKFIDPDLINVLIDQTMDQPGMEAMDDELLTGFMNAEFISFSQIFVGLCCGSVVSLILALILRNETGDENL